MDDENKDDSLKGSLRKKELIQEVFIVNGKVFIDKDFMDKLRFRESIIVQNHLLFNLTIPIGCYKKYQKIYNDFIDYCKKMKLPMRDHNKYKDTVYIVLANLNTVKQGAWLSYSRDKNNYKKSSWNPKGVTLYRLKRFLDYLIEKGYVENFHAISYKQLYDYKYYSPVMRPTDKLTTLFGELKIPSKKKEEVLVLRDSDKKRIELHSTGSITDIDYERITVRAYNNLLSEHTFSIDGVEFENFYQRIYNNSRFDEGGRYYSEVCRFRNKGPDEIHGFETSYRRFKLKIDNEQVVEVDFKSLHPCLLMALKGLPLLYDPYNGYESIYERDVYKISMNIILNSSSRSQAIRTVNHRFKDCDAEDILNFLEDRNKDISDSFYTSCGVHLQYLESKIATGVILKFIDMDKPVIAIHDSFLCKVRDLEVLKVSMFNSFMDVVGDGINTVCVDWEWLDNYEVKNSGARYLVRNIQDNILNKNYEVIK